jgi:hypothetical protein
MAIKMMNPSQLKRIRKLVGRIDVADLEKVLDSLENAPYPYDTGRRSLDWADLTSIMLSFYEEAIKKEQKNG